MVIPEETRWSSPRNTNMAADRAYSPSTVGQRPKPPSQRWSSVLERIIGNLT